MSDLYTSQRAMRAMRRAAIQRGVIALLDRFDGAKVAHTEHGRFAV